MTALVYQGGLDLPFVFDDLTTVLLNPSLVDLRDVRAILFHDPPRTVVNVSYAVDRVSWGFSSFGFHLTNFILHITVVGLFYGWCTRALADGFALAGSGRGQTGVKPKSDPGLTPGVEWAAFFAAAIFALHPVVSATVLYVSARSEIVCAAAFLIGLMFGRRAILTSSTPSGLLAAAAGAVAFGSAPAGAALPVVMLVYDAWMLRTSGCRRRLWRAYVPGMAAIAVGLGWQLHAVGPVSLAGIIYGVLTEAIVLWRYVGLLAVPAGQAVVHEVHWVDSFADPLALISIAAIVGAVAGAIWLRRSVPIISVGVVWFVAALAPAWTIVPLRNAMAEERVYLAAAGLMLAVFASLAPVLAPRRAARIVAAAVLVILAALTSMRTRVWNNPLTLWTEAVERAPGSWVAHLEFAEALREAGQCDRAVAEHTAALALNPHLPLEPRAGWVPCPRPQR